MSPGATVIFKSALLRVLICHKIFDKLPRRPTGVSCPCGDPLVCYLSITFWCLDRCVIDLTMFFNCYRFLASNYVSPRVRIARWCLQLNSDLDFSHLFHFRSAVVQSLRAIQLVLLSAPLTYYGLIHKSSNIGGGRLLQQTFLSLSASRPSTFTILYHKTSHLRQNYHCNWHSEVKQIEDKTWRFYMVSWNVKWLHSGCINWSCSVTKTYTVDSKKFNVWNCKLFIAVQQISSWGVGVHKNFAAFCGNGTFIAIFTRALCWSVSYTKWTWFAAPGVLEDLF